MIIKLDKKTASTEGMSDYIFYYSKNEFGIYPERREKIKFMGTKDDKILDFLGTLELRLHKDWDALRWLKNNKL